MKNTKVLIVEDEAIIAFDIQRALEKLHYNVLLPVDNYEDAINTIEKYHPDIAILDIQLKGNKTGIDVGAIINSSYIFPFIFLTSNNDKYTFSEAKEVQPFAFLSKPFNRTELYNSIELALHNFAKYSKNSIEEKAFVLNDSIFVKTKEGFVRINYDDIDYLKSDNVYIEIITVSKKYIVRGSLNDFSDILDNRFFKSHRSYVINLNKISRFDADKIVLSDQTVVPLSKSNKEELIKKLNIK